MLSYSGSGTAFFGTNLSKNSLACIVTFIDPSMQSNSNAIQFSLYML